MRNHEQRASSRFISLIVGLMLLVHSSLQRILNPHARPYTSFMQTIWKEDAEFWLHHPPNFKTGRNLPGLERHSNQSLESCLRSAEVALLLLRVLSQVSGRLDATLGESYHRNIRQPNLCFPCSHKTSNRDEKAGRRTSPIKR